MPRRTRNRDKTRRRHDDRRGPPGQLPNNLKLKWDGYKPKPKQYPESPHPDE